MPHAHFTLHAWRVSWYSAKVRSYLQVKGIPFNGQKPSLLTVKHSIPRPVVPAVLSPEGDWLQDSSRWSGATRRPRCCRPPRCSVWPWPLRKRSEIKSFRLQMQR